MINGEGKYLYGIIKTNQKREFGSMGIGGRGDLVYTVHWQDLAAIVSSSPITKYPVTRDNSITHQQVLEMVMKKFTVLPVRFCTIAEEEKDIIEKVLKGRYQEFIDLIAKMEGKIELGVRLFWTNMEAIFAEVVEENLILKQLKEEIAKETNEQRKYAGKIKIGQLVKKALEKKKDREAEDLLETLKPLSLDFRQNRVLGDMNLVNAAFLVTQKREQEFDQKIQELERLYGERKKLKYIGPVPPYNFVEVVVTW